jgi:hypothetical protein
MEAVMRRGRPSAGVAVIDQLAAPRPIRRRVRIVLATLAGQLTITEACAQLGVRRTRFFALRYQILHGALAAISARPRGRPRRAPADSAQIRELKARIRELELTLRATLLRSEIALTMPFLLDRAGRGKKARVRHRPRAPHASRARRARGGTS